jgi:polysaccharide pyruvyl transferase WcaK-like protein
MRTILDNGAYSLRNMGDVAMLQVAVKRLRTHLPASEIHILTANPELLARYCPGTLPLLVASRDADYESATPGRSDWQERWARWKSRWRTPPSAARDFQDTLRSAAAVFVAGGGFLNDINPCQSRPLFRMLADAASRGKITALFSQGLGPLQSPELIRMLHRGCRNGTRFGLRESLYGPEILSRARIRPQNQTITGDDAIELAWDAGPAFDGKEIGFSLRQVAYSEVESRDLECLAKAFNEVRQRLNRKFIPLPISFNDHERDHEAAERLTGATWSDAGSDTPEHLINSIGQCRIVLSGTYHAAVFALARGIPCVCFYVSTYYGNKMLGLANQFPGGCEVINLRATDAAQGLVEATLRFWDSWDSDLANKLRTSAEKQMQAGREFYRSVTGSIR